MKPYIYLPQCLETRPAKVKPSRANPARPRSIPELAAAVAVADKARTSATPTTSVSSAGESGGTPAVTPGTPTPAPLMYRASITIPQGDGSVLVKPGKVMHELTPAQAAQHLGVHRNTIYAYIDAGVLRKVRRPSPSRILLDAEEVATLRQATQDPEYWTPERRHMLTGGKH